VWCVTDAENDTTSPVLLLLYEFEAKARLGDPDAERVVDRAMCLPQAEPKLFEAIAGSFSDNCFSPFLCLFFVVFLCGRFAASVTHFHFILSHYNYMCNHMST